MKKSLHHSIGDEMRRRDAGFQRFLNGKGCDRGSGQNSGMYRHVVVKDGAVTGANRIDSLHLEGVAFQIVHSAA